MRPTRSASSHPDPAKPQRRAPVVGRPRTLKLDAECTVAQVDKLKSQLLKLATNRAAITLDAHAVQRIDAPALQVLVAFARGRQVHHLPTIWNGADIVVRRSAAQLGLEQALFAATDQKVLP